MASYSAPDGADFRRIFAQASRRSDRVWDSRVGRSMMKETGLKGGEGGRTRLWGGGGFDLELVMVSGTF